MSPKQLRQWGYLLGFPRVSGDEPARVWIAAISARFSPRERG